MSPDTPASEEELHECPVAECDYTSASESSVHAHSAHGHSAAELNPVYVAELQRVADTLGRPPTEQEMNEHGRFSARTYERRFGSWNDGLRAAGLPVQRYRTLSDDDLLDELRRLADTVGRPPTCAEMREDGHFNPSTYAMRFGSWNDGLRAAGLSARPPGRPPVTDDETG